MADDNETLERIRKRAYELWEADGRPDGQETSHWVQATTEVLTADNEHPIETVSRPDLNLSPSDPLPKPSVKPE